MTIQINMVTKTRGGETRKEIHLMNQTIQVPVTITRSIEVLAVRRNKTQVSRVFTADLGNGVFKTLRRVDWVLTDLLKPCEIGSGNEAVMDSHCPLYARNWATVPTFGDWEKHYPKVVL